MGRGAAEGQKRPPGAAGAVMTGGTGRLRQPLPRCSEPPRASHSEAGGRGRRGGGAGVGRGKGRGLGRRGGGAVGVEGQRRELSVEAEPGRRPRKRALELGVLGADSVHRPREAQGAPETGRERDSS